MRRLLANGWTLILALTLVGAGSWGLFNQQVGFLPTNFVHALWLNLLPGFLGLLALSFGLSEVFLLFMCWALLVISIFGLLNGSVWLYPVFNMTPASSWSEFSVGLITIAVYLLNRRMIDPDPPAPRGPRLEMMILNGLEIAYLDTGPVTGAAEEPCVLLHGYPECLHSWHLIIPALARRQRVLAFDWPGWGESAKVRDQRIGYEFDKSVLLAFLDALGVGRCNLFCYDYGGFVGLGFVEAHPDRVSRFAIMNSRSHRSFPGWLYYAFAWICWLAQWPWGRHLVTLLPLEPVHRLGLTFEGRGCFSEPELDHYLNWLASRDGKRWFVHFFAHYHLPVRPELGQNLAIIPCPTAVIWTTADPWCPVSTARELAERIPNAELTLIPGGHHFLLEEKPEEVTQALLHFLDEA
ncbi:MAG TPA: alpha/beta hydrolase [Candidatus Obscuribacterales bacterium]